MGGIISLLRELQTKISCSFMKAGVGGGEGCEEGWESVSQRGAK